MEKTNELESAARAIKTRIDLKRFLREHCELSRIEAAAVVREIASDNSPDETLDEDDGTGPRTRMVKSFRLAHERAGWKDRSVRATTFLNLALGEPSLRDQARKRLKEQGYRNWYFTEWRHETSQQSKEENETDVEILNEETAALLDEINRCNSNDQLAALLCRRGWKDEDTETFIERFGHSEASLGKFQEWWEKSDKPSYQTKG